MENTTSQLTLTNSVDTTVSWISWMISPTASDHPQSNTPQLELENNFPLLALHDKSHLDLPIPLHHGDDINSKGLNQTSLFPQEAHLRPSLVMPSPWINGPQATVNPKFTVIESRCSSCDQAPHASHQDIHHSIHDGMRSMCTNWRALSTPNT